MAFPIAPPLPPMDAQPVRAIPDGEGWQYEPKWDGFRCLAFRDGAAIHLQSKSGQPLGRYFPEIVAALATLRSRRFVLDGELVVPVGRGASFSALQLRLHPAESRVRRLAAETPARYLVFDLLALGSRLLLERPLTERRAALEDFAAARFASARGSLELSRASRRRRDAEAWFRGSLPGLDGVMAKRLDLAYRSGERDGMVKVKRLRTADCVVGGFRYGSGSPLVGSLLLGLYDHDGLLHHVGFAATIARADKPALTKRLERLRSSPGFTGRAPGGPSRWSTERTGEWEPLRPELVVEVVFDHVDEQRFRHGTRLLRWRTDKKPEQCTMEQIGAWSGVTSRPRIP
jgi:ATP-dependent DNA ligase